MKIHVAFDKELNCVIARLEGALTLSAAREYAREVSAVATTHPCYRVLTDLRQASTLLSPAELSQIPERVVTKAFGRQWHRAILLAPTADLRKVDFYQLVALSRGLIVGVFTDFDKAIRWLRTPSGANSDSS